MANVNQQTLTDTERAPPNQSKHMVFDVYSIFFRLVYDMRGPTEFLLKPVAANASMLKRTKEKSPNMYLHVILRANQSMSLFFFYIPSAKFT